jgi:hypothetical protein
LQLLYQRLNQEKSDTKEKETVVPLS